MLNVIKGDRPSVPPPYPSKTRGLCDAVWSLVVACWSQNPLDRPTTGHVVERLRALPDRPADQRPVDDFTVKFPPALHHTEHPFSVLTAATWAFVSHPPNVSILNHICFLPLLGVLVLHLSTNIWWCSLPMVIGLGCGNPPRKNWCDCSQTYFRPGGLSLHRLLLVDMSVVVACIQWRWRPMLHLPDKNR